MSLINYLNCKFLLSKIMHKNKFINHIVNNIRLTKKYICVKDVNNMQSNV